MKSQLNLVTGGAGFIGSHVVDLCLAKGHEITVLDNLTTGRAENLAHVKNQIEFVECDLGSTGTGTTWVPRLRSAREFAESRACASTDRGRKEKVALEGCDGEGGQVGNAGLLAAWPPVS